MRGAARSGSDVVKAGTKAGTMTKRLLQHSAVLKKLKKCDSKQRKKLLKQGGKALQLCLQECALNILNGNVPLTPFQLKKLRRYKDKLRKLTKKRTSLKEKVAIEQRGGFLPALLAPVVGAVLGAILKKR